VSVFLAARTCSGKLSYALGAATLKARSPNFRRDLGTRKSDLMAECKTVERDECQYGLQKVRYVCRTFADERWTSRHNLNSMRASTGSQCSSIVAAETWSRERIVGHYRVAVWQLHKSHLHRYVGPHIAYGLLKVC